MIFIELASACNLMTLMRISKHEYQACIELAMALWRRGDVAQAFRNNPNLQQFMLTDVTSTDRILGTGSYGSVVEVNKSTGSLELSN